MNIRLTSKVVKIATLLTSILCLFAITPILAQDVFVGLNSNGGPEGKGTAYSIKPDGTGFSLIKGFVDWGGTPNGDLVRAPDGYFYGMTYDGGTYNHGTLFRISSAGRITIIKNFNLTVDGGYPKGSLVVGTDGNLYGMTSGGSVNNGGAIFKLVPSTGVYSIIRSLSINVDGGRPQGDLIQAKDGYLYGINSAGGANGYGTVFKIKTDGTLFTVVKAMVQTTGATSYGSLVQASNGDFYGMTYLGGTSNSGVIFRITLAGVYSVLRSFNGTTDGQYPYGELIQAKDGFLYGMTNRGGANGIGTIFKIKTDGTSFSVIRSMSLALEGGNPQGSLLQASDGNLYGMTYSTTGTGTNGGCVFRISPTTLGVTVIKKFTVASEGGYPRGSLIQAPDGYFYGMTGSGGLNGRGTIFRVNTVPTLNVLCHLNGDGIGNVPQDNLVIGKDSAYFGTTQYGGATNYGTVFKICGGVTTLIRSLNRNTDGGNPQGGLVRAPDGNLYGMTETGGTNGAGTIYRVTPTGGFTVIKHLSNATDGGSPRGSLVVAPDGHMYGITYSGGTGAGGTIFRITTGAVFTVLKNLAYATEGSSSESGLAVGTDGNLYGITGSNPRFFRITTGGQFTVLKTFTYAEGTTPFGSLVLGTDGNFYGTMSAGGSYGKGTIFRITNAGQLFTLRHINGTTDGSNPKGGLVKGSDGYFYGTTSTGGNNKFGTIFKIHPSGTPFTVIRHLKIETDGGNPLGGLMLAPRNTLVANGQSAVSTNEDVAKAITLTGTGGSIFNIVVQPRRGTITTGTSATRTYTPAANYSGKDSFAFTVAASSCLASAPAWVVINVSAVNDAPVLTTIGNKTITLGTTLTFTATATDVDANQTKTFSLIGAPVGAVINSTSGAFSWKPATAGIYTCTVRVTDNGSPALYDDETITITVNSTAGFGTEEEGGMTVEFDLRQKIKLTIWPNPSTSYFNLKFEGTKSKTEGYKNKTIGLRIMNDVGQVVETRSGISVNTTLQLGHNYHPGVYIVEVLQGPKKVYAQLVKQ